MKTCELPDAGGNPEDGGTPLDGGTNDGGPNDGGSDTDAGTGNDAGTSDDAGPADGGAQPDAGLTDAGTTGLDAGPADGGPPPCSELNPCPADQVCSAGTCVECVSDADCLAVTSRPPFCAPQLDVCVACVDNSACPRGEICDQAQFACVPGCVGGSGLSNCPPSTVCDPALGTSGACVTCVQASDCGMGQICVGLGQARTCVDGCAVNQDCPVGRVCNPALGSHGQCVGCVTNNDCVQELACDATTMECRCKKEGESCAADSECGYRLIPSSDGGLVPDCHAPGARCLTKVRCGATGCSVERAVRNVCVLTGQGLANQCDPDETSCPAGFVNEFGASVGISTFTKLCVPEENACLYPYCGNGCL